MIKKDFLITTEDMRNVMHCSLLADFKNGDKNVKTFLKGEQILLLMRKFYRKIGRKLTISHSNEMSTKCFKSVNPFQLVP